MDPESQKRMLALIAEDAKKWKADAYKEKYAPKPPPTSDPLAMLKGGPSYKNSELATMQPGELPEAAPSSEFQPPEAEDLSAMKLPSANDALAGGMANENSAALSSLQDDEKLKALLASLKR